MTSNKRFTKSMHVFLERSITTIFSIADTNSRTRGCDVGFNTEVEVITKDMWASRDNSGPGGEGAKIIITIRGDYDRTLPWVSKCLSSCGIGNIIECDARVGLDLTDRSRQVGMRTLDNGKGNKAE